MLAEFDRIIATNLRGPFLVARAAIPHMLRNDPPTRGAIVHMSSVCAVTVWARDCAYDISKAGLNMLSDHIAVEYGSRGIRSNTLMPGVIRTELHESVMEAMDDGRAFERELLRRHPIGRFETVHDIAGAMSGRRGALVNAIGALDIALWDIAGQAAGVPTWQLLGPRARDQLVPYASLQPEVSSFDAYLESIVGWAKTAREIGFTAAKIEATFSGPYAHKGLEGPDAWIEEVVRAVRHAAGPQMTLVVDVQYAFDSVERACGLPRRWSRSTYSSSRPPCGSTTSTVTRSSGGARRCGSRRASC